MYILVDVNKVFNKGFKSKKEESHCVYSSVITAGGKRDVTLKIISFSLERFYNYLWKVLWQIQMNFDFVS